jgi:hypothetical protein
MQQSQRYLSFIKDGLFTVVAEIEHDQKFEVFLEEVVVQVEHSTQSMVIVRYVADF